LSFPHNIKGDHKLKLMIYVNNANPIAQYEIQRVNIIPLSSTSKICSEKQSEMCT
jgi:hypothetical protein